MGKAAAKQIVLADVGDTRLLKHPKITRVESVGNIKQNRQVAVRKQEAFKSIPDETSTPVRRCLGPKNQPQDTVLEGVWSSRAFKKLYILGQGRPDDNDIYGTGGPTRVLIPNFFPWIDGNCDGEPRTLIWLA